ncbi:glycoside hydrolase family 15 protein [Robertkochia flava]|uniref:glycoside hydrolase family 15 protein n=1 Tax=Robertkochia flava TaxID=3447986 RepID=UPI001CCA7160|nr:glycoside hydrolase family 15 protein [Robertkochia marina]
MDNLDYGIIGNCRSAALVSRDGSIHWACLPEFDSPSVFAKLLDDEIGGSFGFKVSEKYRISQEYMRNTNILITRFTNGKDCFEVRDFMPRYKEEIGSHYTPPDIVRYIKHISGKPKFRVKYDPKLEYAKGTTSTYIKDEFVESLTDKEKYDTLFLYTNFDKTKVVQGEEIILHSDGFFTMGYNEKIFPPTTERAHLELSRTMVYWLNWMERTPSYDKYNDYISRSALTLKMLSYDKSGAVLAAATTSLPETIGEVRNWDYRFCWIRDASMVIKVVSELGHKNIARRYLQFIIDLVPDKDEKLQIMYGINKEKMLTEETLDHLKGYKNSRPVRIGNAAYEQRQNDIYGILMDVIYEQVAKFKNDIENSEELWAITKGIVWVVNRHWKEPDKGIWEFRTEERHFTFSKVLCWVAVDKALKVADLLGKYRRRGRWLQLAETIKEDILKNAWNEEAGAFTQSYGSEDLDASVLLMEPYGFIDAMDPKYVDTVHAIERELSFDGLLYRYKNKDDFGLPSSSFTICTFWFINALNKIGETDRAVAYFEKLLSYSNHLGLFSEDIDFKTKRLLGNFPQAYSHLALIETAVNLNNSISHQDTVMGKMHR